MASKIFTRLVVVFWVVMMTALVRMEYFPRSPKFLARLFGEQSDFFAVPVSRVLDRVFQNARPADMLVFHQGREIGSCLVEVTPMTGTEDGLGQESALATKYYDVRYNVHLTGPPRIFFNGKANLDPRYQVQDIRLRTNLGFGRSEVHADNVRRTLVVEYGAEDGWQHREISYDDLRGPNLFRSLGLPEMSNLPVVGLLTGGGGETPNWTSNVVVQCSYDYLKVGPREQRMYLVEVRSDPALGVWAKLWIDEQGNLLVIEDSLGVSLRSRLILLESGQLSLRRTSRS